eukprot:gene38415-50439_t
MKPKDVKIGVMTPMSTTSWDLDTGTQYLGAILMAVNEINKDKNLLPSTRIRIAYMDSKLDAGLAFFRSLELASKAFNNTGVQAVLGPETSSESISSALVFKAFDIPQISMSATSPDLSSKKNYPYFARTCPSDAFQGRAMAELVKHFGWTRVTTFANSDSYGQSDFSEIIKKAKKTSSRIFIIFADQHDAANLLEQGYDAGLFGTDTQIIGSDSLTGSNTWSTMPESKRIAIMRGYLGFALFTDLTVSLRGKSFMSRFTSQASTAMSSDGSCNTQLDDEGNYLWKEVDAAAGGQVYCGGTNYSQLALDGSNMDPFVPYAYDATYALANALHIQLYVLNASTVNGQDLFDTLIRNVSFEGVTGHVSFASAQSNDEQRFAEGDRQTGVSYAVYNFQPDVYRSDSSGTLGLVTVGGWTSEGGIQMCTDSVTGCSHSGGGSGGVIFNTDNNDIPSDSPPDVELFMSP